ncbi:hypothetical protein Clacol_001600 [Clathrus columnatus]|uniref:Elongation factor 1 alpha-like protein n=1 Tax=Clathrus columnatus TaxID=1419009 RepID=A0AAV5A1N9_9AGAM|nr:hypothetical protein Clacol_001600 [Clathrus columnatus]
MRHLHIAHSEALDVSYPCVDELDDDALSDGGEEDFRLEQFDMAFAQARSILGSEENSGISDKQIKDTVWEFYFDVEKSIDWLLGGIEHETSLPSQQTLSALQRLSLTQRIQPNKPSLVSLAKVSQEAPSSTSKPIKSIASSQTVSTSKLSLLAQGKESKLLSSSSLQRLAKPSIMNTKTTSPVQSKLALKAMRVKETSITKSASLDDKLQALTTQESYSLPPTPDVLGLPSPFALTLSSSTLSPVVMPRAFSFPVSTFAFETPSPDDLVLQARQKTALTALKQQKGANKVIPTPKKSTLNASPQILKATTSKATSSASTTINVTKTAPSVTISQEELDLAALNISAEPKLVTVDELPKASFAREALLQLARLEIQEQKPRINLVVIGHVDAGKSTLMGRLLYDLGKIDEKTRLNTVRASEKSGKGSFSWAWELDGTVEERQRGITMDIALQDLSTTHRNITILDAPGHRDFIPNMISGAFQADCALLVVDSSTGEFEAGFDKGGQTKEHLLLVRSLGVSQVIVAVNKLDLVDWKVDRYEKIVSDLRGFLTQAGFPSSRTNFVPVSAIGGTNLIATSNNPLSLRDWYNGPSLIDLLDQLETPPRSLELPLRIPISNVFKGQMGSASGLAVTGRVCSGIVQVGERLRILPGNETTTVRSIEQEGSVLCLPSELVPLASKFSAQVIIFDISLPITPGAPVEMFYHSRDVPATITRLLATLDRGSSTIVKNNPRVLLKHTSAKVEIAIRNTLGSSGFSIPVEPFRVNKELGRLVLRRGGETIAAGMILLA